MSFEIELSNDLRRVDDLIRERDMAAAYIRITEEMGPCPQLLAFVNYDNAVTADDGTGLETLNMFDQHNLLVNKLNPDVMDNMAMESLSEVLKKYRGVLVVGGAIATIVGFGGTLLPLTAIIAGTIGFVKNARACQPVKNFSKLTQAFDLAYSMDSKFVNSMPTTLDKKAWETFTEEHVFNPGDPKEDAVEEMKEKREFSNPDFDKSGWNPETYSNAVKWMVAAHAKLEKSAKDQAAKIDKLLALVASSKNLDSKTSSLITKSIAESARSMHTSNDVFDDIKKLLTKVGHNFEEKKK